MNNITKKAVKIAGGSSEFARALNKAGVKITRQAIEQWHSVPPHHVRAVEKITGISRYKLRPDIYGPAPKKTDREPSSDGSRVAEVA